MTMKIQLLSDLHLGFRHESLPRISAEADVLVFAGDMSSTKKRLIDYFEGIRKDHDMPIIMVLGNHDYYGHYLSAAAGKMKRWVQDIDEVYILARDTVTIDGVKFVGTTLWTDFAKRRDEVAVGLTFPDYREVKKVNEDYNITTIDTIDILEAHDVDKEWLKKVVKLEEKTVIVTHHVPTDSCIPSIYDGSTINGGFYVDMSTFILDYEPDLWLCGHTHYHLEADIGTCRIRCNPWGYPFESDNAGHYIEEFIVEV